MLRPRRPKLTPLPKIYLFCEGAVTEPAYFEGIRVARRIPPTRVVIRKGQGDPKSIVEAAIRMKEQNDAENRGLGLAVRDTVWAVFDRDDHLGIADAKQKAMSSGIQVAFSNPCFELFLLYHFQDLNRAEHRRKVVRLLAKHIPGYEKSIDYVGLGLHDLYNEAKKRCLSVNARSESKNQVECAPYCSVFSLVDSLRKL